MPTPPRRIAPAGLCVVAVALMAPFAAAEAPDARTILGSSVEALDAPDFVTRDRASEELNEALLRLRTGNSAGSWTEVERALVRAASDGELSIEARVRILASLKRQFFESPRAAIGISFAPNPNDPREIRIQQVHKGFPAGDTGVLHAGDVIVSIDGVPISGSVDYMNTTRSMICSRDPGDIVKIAVARADENNAEIRRMTVDVPLGSFDQLIRPDLPRADQIGIDALESAWRVRLERLGWTPDAELSVLDASLPAADWHRFERSPRAQRAPRITLAEARPGAEEFTIAQMTNGGERLSDARRAGAAPDQLEKLRLALGGERNAMRRNAAVVVNADDPDRALLLMLQNQIAERLQIASRYAQQLERMNITEAERFRLRAQHDREMQAIAELQMQIRDITSQIEAQRILRERRNQPRQP